MCNGIKYAFVPTLGSKFCYSKKSGAASTTNPFIPSSPFSSSLLGLLSHFPAPTFIPGTTMSEAKREVSKGMDVRCGIAVLRHCRPASLSSCVIVVNVEISSLLFSLCPHLV